MRFMPMALGVAVVLGVAGRVAAYESSYGAKPATAQAKFSARGVFIDACTCTMPCACTLTGPNMSCEGLGAFSFTGGNFNGQSVAGAKVAYALAAGDWFRLYVDAKDPKVAKAAAALMAKEFEGFGRYEGSTPAKVAISGSAGNYSISVNDGKIMMFTTKAVMGGDGKSPVMYSNAHSKLSPSFKQGTVVSGSYKDAGHAFTLKDSNAYFNEKVKSSGAY